MHLTPSPWWPIVALAAILLSDILMSIRPLKFIRVCLDGVGFPHSWWWILIVIKSLAVIGLLAGIRYPGIAFAANVCVIVYFLAASYAHIRASFVKKEFWVNCLGFLALAVACFLISFVF